MKKLILSEGKNDTYFLKQVIQNHVPSIEIDVVDIEDHSIDEQKPFESEQIREFVPRFNPYAMLMKSEGGQNSLKKVFCSLVAHLSSLALDFCICGDLDGGSPEDYVEDLNERISDIHSGNNVQLEHNRRVTYSELIVVEEYDVVLNHRIEDEFLFIAFRHSLEDAADINRDESWEVKQEKIDLIIDDSRLKDPITDTLC